MLVSSVSQHITIEDFLQNMKPPKSIKLRSHEKVKHILGPGPFSRCKMFSGSIHLVVQHLQKKQSLPLQDKISVYPQLFDTLFSKSIAILAYRNIMGASLAGFFL